MSLKRTKLNAQILEEAAEWFVEVDREEVDRVTRQRFDDWLRRSPEHVQAFLELLPIWEQGAQHRSSSGTEAESLITQALNARDNVFPLKTRPSSSSRVQSNLRERLRVGASIAASVLIVALGAWFYSERNTYSTGIGEQRSLALADGSVVELNARSRVRIRYGEQQRNIDLLEGQALFEVAHDKDRPFVVHSGDARIRAIGTQFDVYRKRTGTTVTVVEGRVTVMPEQRSSRSGTAAQNTRLHADVQTGKPIPPTRRAEHVQLAELRLSAGEQATIAANAVESNAAANVAAATAWTQRRLMFQKTTLAEVVHEFNRYNERPMRIDDQQIQEFLVSGTFSSTDPTSLLRFLREQPGMRVIETSHEVRIELAP